ncbi:cell division inhibition protein DicB [Escherichia coli]
MLAQLRLMPKGCAQ